MIFVGLSGGVDSMVLLHKLCQKYDPKDITAIHVNHHISKNADYWEMFCRNHCEGNNINFVSKQVHLTGKSEDEARRHRYNAFRECCSEIYLAHHADDDVETILFKMIRGCGLTGLKGMKDDNTYEGLKVIRPMLSMSKDEIYQYAIDNKIVWVSDESNESDSFSRNFLRNQIIPNIKAKFPTVISAMTRMKENVSEADDLITEVAMDDLVSTNLNLDLIMGLTPLRRRNLIRYYVRSQLGNLPPTTQFNEFMRQLEQATNGKQPKMVVGNAEIGIKDKRLYHINSK